MSIIIQIKKGVLFPILVYLRYSPIMLGKGKLVDFSKANITSKIKEDITFFSKDGRLFKLHFPEDHEITSFYYGDYEIGTTNLLKKVLKKDDVLFDMGANYGWYTTLFGKIAYNGECHSFEPLPWVYDKLKVNCHLNGLKKNVFLNNVALGNKRGNIQINYFPDLPHGHSSISNLGMEKYEAYETDITTLNDYIREKSIKRINVIKCDIEGSEMEMLKGGIDVFSLETPPVWLFEMNDKTSQAFGYSPFDILEFLLEFNDYEFVRIEHAWGKHQKMQDVNDYENGDNVLCFVPKIHKQIKDLI